MPITIDTDGVKEVFDAGRKLEPTAVGLQWLFMVALSLATISIFSALRPGNKIIYQPKVKYHGGNNAPPPISTSLFGWISPLVRTQDSDLVDKMGVDALVFLHFIRLLRWMFLVIAVASCGILVPIDYLYNVKHRPQDINVLSAMSIRDVKGPMLYAHVGLAYFITFTVIAFVNSRWKKVHALRMQWFHSPDYLRSFYSRTLCITQVPPQHQSDQGINDILASVKMPYPATGVHIGRNIGKLAELIDYHNDTVRQLERVLVKYLRKGKLGRKRPTIRVGGWCCCGGEKKDAISFYTAKLRRTEATINEYRARIDTRQPTNYGFASLAAVPYAHFVAQKLSGEHPKGVDVDLAPNPRDIIWSNISDTRGTRIWKKTLGFLWLALICILSLVPLFFAATLANLDVVTRTGYLPFLVSWSDSSQWTYTIASATLPPVAAGITTFFLPRIMRRLSKYMGAFTRSHLDRAVIARYFAFLVISQLLIFTLIGVGFSMVLDVINTLQSPGAKLSTVFSKLSDLPRDVSRTYVNQAAYWLKWFPLRGFLMLIDLTKIPSLIWIPLKTYFFGRTPRDIREWTTPPTFEYAINYSNLLFCAAVGLLFAPLTPLVALAAALVLWSTSWVYKYQLLYIFVTQVETGGRLWNAVINRVLTCVVFMQLLMALTIGLQYNFALIQSLLMIPSILIVLLFKLYIRSAYLRHFRYFIPRAEDFANIASYSENADVSTNKILRRFGHPALHAELFAPMLHQKMMPLLREVYGGKINPKEEERPFVRPHPSQGNGFSQGSNFDPNQLYKDIPQSPASVPASPAGLNLQVVTQVLYDVLFRGVAQNDLEYDPASYARDIGEIDWEATTSPPSPLSSYEGRPRQRARLQKSNQTSFTQGTGQEERQSFLQSDGGFRPPSGYHQYPPTQYPPTQYPPTQYPPTQYPPTRASYPQHSYHGQYGSQGSQEPRHYSSWSGDQLHGNSTSFGQWR